MSGLGPMWQDLRRQFAENWRLRMISWAVLAVIWLYLLLMAQDALQPRRAALEVGRAEIERLQSMEGAGVWNHRGRDARQLLQAAQALTWMELRPGLGQAEVQDWLRTLASKTGLTLKDLRLAAAEPVLPASGSAGRAPEHVRVRLSAEFTQLSLVAFLNELGLAERGIVIERLQLKTWTRPQQLELDLRVRLRGSEASSS